MNGIEQCSKNYRNMADQMAGEIDNMFKRMDELEVLFYAETHEQDLFVESIDDLKYHHSELYKQQRELTQAQECLANWIYFRLDRLKANIKYLEEQFEIEDIDGILELNLPDEVKELN